MWICPSLAWVCIYYTVLSLKAFIKPTDMPKMWHLKLTTLLLPFRLKNHGMVGKMPCILIRNDIKDWNRLAFLLQQNGYVLPYTALKFKNKPVIICHTLGFKNKVIYSINNTSAPRCCDFHNTYQTHVYVQAFSPAILTGILIEDIRYGLPCSCSQAVELLLRRNQVVLLLAILLLESRALFSR